MAGGTRAERHAFPPPQAFRSQLASSGELGLTRFGAQHIHCTLYSPFWGRAGLCCCFRPEMLSRPDMRNSVGFSSSQRAATSISPIWQAVSMHYAHPPGKRGAKKAGGDTTFADLLLLTKKRTPRGAAHVLSTGVEPVSFAWKAKIIAVIPRQLIHVNPGPGCRQVPPPCPARPGKGVKPTAAEPAFPPPSRPLSHLSVARHGLSSAVRKRTRRKASEQTRSSTKAVASKFRSETAGVYSSAL